ncbi:glycosyltransferase family 4 protein [Brevibacillus panacihumi]|uniref:glycosyltransferase family 4 protein n=1 Tax=Brevibacillus panacihumi TaxID=497735 RepID=UPI003CFC77D8
MNLLYITYFYPPEIGAASNRASMIINRLKSDGGFKVTVLRPVPSYPFGERLNTKHQTRYKLFFKESDGDKTEIISINVPVAKNGSFFKRILGNMIFLFLAFFFLLIHSKKYNTIITSSPPFLINYLGLLYVKITKKRSWILEVRDLWPDSLLALGMVEKGSLVYRTLKRMELCFYKNATKIICVTKGIKNTIDSQIPEEKTKFIPNGVFDWDKDDIVSNTEKINKLRETFRISMSDKIIGYIGNVGKAQGLDFLIKLANETKGITDIKYIVVGNGSDKENLKKMSCDYHLSNVIFIDAISDKKQLCQIYNFIDIGIVLLKDEPLFEGAVPSKLFDLLSFNKYILLGVKGEAKELLKDDTHTSFIDSNDITGTVDTLLNVIRHESYKTHSNVSNIRRGILNERSWDKLFSDYKDVLIEGKNDEDMHVGKK